MAIQFIFSNKETEIRADFRAVITTTKLLLPVHGATFDSLIENHQFDSKDNCDRNGQDEEDDVCNESLKKSWCCTGWIQI